MPILLPLIIIPIIIYLAWYNSPRQKGKRGERFVSKILSQLPEEYIVLNDLVFPTEKGTTQVDHVVVSKYGVFAIETKNYRGEIYGDDNRQEWTQLIVTEVTYAKKWWKTYTYVTKNHLYNPVKQSIGHAYRIKELLKAYPHLKIIPIVVFTGEASLSNVASSHHVIYNEQLLSIINQYKTIYLTDEGVQSVLNILQENNIRESVTDNQHVRNLRATKSKEIANINAGICPKCGGRLVERCGKYGSFYGCSNYPKCMFTVQ